MNQIDKMNQKDQLAKLPGTRREMGPAPVHFPLL